MSKRCSICDKKAKRAASRSHSNIKTLRRQKPNLQKIGNILMCARCARAKTKNID